MSDSQGAARVNLTLPRELKARMEAVKEPVNWSAVAARAFEAELLDLESKKEVKNMDEVIERLRASKAKATNEDTQAGLKTGRRWAKGQAGVQELERVEKLIADVGRGYDSLGAYIRDSLPIIAGSTDCYSLSEKVYFQMFPEDNGDRTAAASFWERTLVDNAGKAVNPVFLEAFLEGAEEVWDAVKDRL
jgi:hypothetical protein